LAPERASEKPSFPTGKCARRAHFSTSIQLKGHIFRVRLPVLRVFRLCSAGSHISRRWTADGREGRQKNGRRDGRAPYRPPGRAQHDSTNGFDRFGGRVLVTPVMTPM
jgi:hypothetical protein